MQRECVYFIFCDVTKEYKKTLNLQHSEEKI